MSGGRRQIEEMFDALKYLREHRVRYVTSGKDTSAGWLGVSCPFCRDPEMHGGFSPDDYYSCWRCGGHSVEDVIMALERCEYHEACQIVIEYQTDFPSLPARARPRRAQGQQGHLTWPPGVMPLLPLHIAYLIRRRFDPGALVERYGIRATGPLGPYAWRIMAPVVLNGKMVSYQGRDITDKADLRYKACRKELELVDHKTILYNLDNSLGDSAIVVEGLFDCWRLGDGCVATMGSTIIKPQVMMLAERFKRIFVILDSEPEAQSKARKLCQQLSLLGVEVINKKLNKGDPDDLSQGDADELKKECLG
jgi:hypothetical protein